jgi:hypothetical protein
MLEWIILPILNLIAVVFTVTAKRKAPCRPQWIGGFRSLGWRTGSRAHRWPNTGLRTDFWVLRPNIGSSRPSRRNADSRSPCTLPERQVCSESGQPTLRPQRSVSAITGR